MMKRCKCHYHGGYGSTHTINICLEGSYDRILDLHADHVPFDTSFDDWIREIFHERRTQAG